jgi:hypothetical protein
VGEYAGVGRGRPRRFAVAAGDSTPLVLRVNGGPAEPLAYLGGDTFGRGPNRFVFVRERGRVTALRVDNRVAYAVAPRVAPAPSAAGGGAR